MKRWTLVLAGLVLGGCSSAPKVEKIPDSADASAEIHRLQEEMADVQKEHQTDILSPKAWSEASYHLKKAQTRLNDQASKRRVLDSVAEARAWMNQARENGDDVQQVIPDILQVRKEAIDVDAPGYAAREFDYAETYLKAYTRDREGSKFGIKEDRRSDFRKNYINARVTALQNRQLGAARRALKEAEEHNAKVLVPNLYENAVRSVNNANAFIAANRMDVEAIENVARKATLQAERMSALTNEAIASRQATPEQRALAMERLKQRSQRLSETLEKQGQRLSRTLDQQEFQEKFDEARGMFDVDEAEVYKQGNSLLLRLKGIQFPVGASTLPTDSYPLITKVGTTIKNFGEGTKVRIEGQTDGTGGKAVNQRLGLARAEAVKTYLTANVGMQPEMIETVSVGYARPIASNKTSEGRTLNRRVDVFIIPQVESGPQIRQAQ